MIENVEFPSPQSLKQPLADKVLCRGCSCNDQRRSSQSDIAKLETVEANLKQEKEKNAQLEALILALSSKLEMFHSLASSLDIEVKNDTKAGNLQEVQELYRKTSSIEAHQVATDLEEATGIKIQEDIEFQEIPGFLVQEILDLEGRQAANHLEKEQNKKRKWRRGGIKKLSTDFRDVF